MPLSFSLSLNSSASWMPGDRRISNGPRALLRESCGPPDVSGVTALLHDLGDDVILGLTREKHASAIPSYGCMGNDEGWLGGASEHHDRFAHLHVLQAVLLAYTPEHILLAALLQFSSNQELVEDEVGLLEIEDDVQLAHVAVVLVHLLDIAMHDLEGDQFIVGGVTAGDEEEGGISAVDDLCV